jgi:hypothetical protein
MNIRLVVYRSLLFLLCIVVSGCGTTLSFKAIENESGMMLKNVKVEKYSIEYHFFLNIRTNVIRLSQPESGGILVVRDVKLRHADNRFVFEREGYLDTIATIVPRHKEMWIEVNGRRVQTYTNFLNLSPIPIPFFRDSAEKSK